MESPQVIGPSRGHADVTWFRSRLGGREHQGVLDLLLFELGNDVAGAHERLRGFDAVAVAVPGDASNTTNEAKKKKKKKWPIADSKQQDNKSDQE